MKQGKGSSIGIFLGEGGAIIIIVQSRESWNYCNHAIKSFSCRGSYFPHYTLSLSFFCTLFVVVVVVAPFFLF